jgi:hypothetical protein
MMDGGWIELLAAVFCCIRYWMQHPCRLLSRDCCCIMLLAEIACLLPQQLAMKWRPYTYNHYRSKPVNNASPCWTSTYASWYSPGLRHLCSLPACLPATPQRHISPYRCYCIMRIDVLSACQELPTPMQLCFIRAWYRHMCTRRWALAAAVGGVC